MKTLLNQRLKIHPMLRQIPVIIALLLLSAVGVKAQVSTATVTSDKPDYAPRSNAVFTGSGFAAFENVVLKVKNLNQPCNTLTADSSYLPWSAVADANGGFVTNWTVCDCPGDSLRLKATGQTSGLIAYAYFTDGNVTFNASGLPAGQSVTVNYSYQPNPNSTINGSLTITAPAPSEPISVSNNKILTYTYPANIIDLTGVHYTFISSTPSSPFVVGGGSQSVFNVTATYKKTTTLTVSAASGRVNENVTIAADLTASGTSVSGKTVTFTINGNTYPATTNAGGTATASVNLSSYSVNQYTISASFAGDGSYTSSTGSGQLVVNPACTSPSIVGQPVAQLVTYGGNATFTGSASGTAPLSYQWEVSSDAGSSWSPVSDAGVYAGANTASLTLTRPSVSMNGYKYRLVVTNDCGNATSNGIASLSVTAKALTGSFTAQTKTYDGTTAATVLTRAIATGIEGNDDVVLTGGVATFADADAGTGKTVTLSGASLSGTDAANYSLNSVNSTSANIDPINLVVTPDPNQEKVFGAADPVFTYTTSAALLSGNSFSGALARSAGENVTDGPYLFTLGTLSAGNNYTLSLGGTQTFAITPKTIAIAADAKSKIYGDADPALTYTVSSGTLEPGDSFTGNLTRIAGENTGTFSIGQGSLSLNSNYSLSYSPADLTISQRGITITADAKSKIYGDTDPALTYQITSGTLAFNDAFSGSLARIAGEDVDSYSIIQGTVSLSSNYSLSFAPADLTISQRAITITADAKTKTYGDADPALTAQVTTGTIVQGDVASGDLTRTTGENVATYTINQGTYTYGTNYDITYVPADFTISARPIAIAADTKTKIYGDPDPALSYQITSGNLVGSDVFNGSLNRALGEQVGSYAIGQGTVALSSNYSLSYTSADLTISARSITITAGAKSKIYGDTDPALTYQITSGTLAFNDAFSGSLTRIAGVDVGTYNISQGTVALDQNYTLTYLPADLTITARAVAIAADAQTKIYGDPDPALTYQITSGNLIGSDAFSGSLTRALGEQVGTYNIGQGTVALSSNYTLSYAPADLSISQRAITITADAQSKTYGDTDPALTYQITNGTLAFNDAFSGSLTRIAGEGVGTYNITQGTVALDQNYMLTYNPADLTISQRAITITADAKTKTYGDADPALTAQVTTGTIVQGDVASGDLIRATGENAATYTINQGTYTYGTNYDITYVPADFTITQKAASVTPAAAGKTYGATDPALSGILTGFLASDNVSATYTRTAGETVAGGPYTISASLSPAGVLSNYDITYHTALFTITKADATITVSGYTGTYDGDAHGATGSATGIHNENLSSLLDLGASFTNAPGGTAAWTFAGNDNYNPGNGSATITINKADATISVTGYSGIYDANSHSATGSATGVKSENLTSLLNLGSGFTDAPGGTANWLFAGNGNYKSASGTAAIVINKATPVISLSALEQIYNGQGLTASVTVKGVNNATLGGIPAVTYKHPGGTGFIATLPVFPGTYEVKAVYAETTNYTSAEQTANLVVLVPQVTISDIQAPLSPLNISVATAALSATFNNNAPFTTVWDCGDGTLHSGNSNNGRSDHTHTFTQTGVYKIKLHLKINGQTIATKEYQYVVVYDPNGSFITGGGWFNSPPTAIVNNLGGALTTGIADKAHFGFNSKYTKGKNTPDGSAQFQFKAGGLEFNSLTNDWLVVSGATAKYKGVGKIKNDTRDFSFMIYATDGDVQGKLNSDKFRIKIWLGSDETNVIYDNAPGDDNLTASSTIIGGGSIVVHEAPKQGGGSPKRVTASSEPNTETIAIPLTNYPNPFSDGTTIRFGLSTDEPFELAVYDIRGALIKKIDAGTAVAGKEYEFKLDGNYLTEGIYFIRLTTKEGIQTLKAVKKRL